MSEREVALKREQEMSVNAYQASDRPKPRTWEKAQQDWLDAGGTRESFLKEMEGLYGPTIDRRAEEAAKLKKDTPPVSLTKQGTESPIAAETGTGKVGGMTAADLQAAYDDDRTGKRRMPTGGELAARPLSAGAEAVKPAVASTIASLSTDRFNPPDLQDVYSAARAQHPNLSRQDFNTLVAQLSREGKVRLHSHTRAMSEVQHPEAALLVDGEVMTKVSAEPGKISEKIPEVPLQSGKGSFTIPSVDETKPTEAKGTNVRATAKKTHEQEVVDRYEKMLEADRARLATASDNDRGRLQVSVKDTEDVLRILKEKAAKAARGETETPHYNPISDAPVGQLPLADEATRRAQHEAKKEPRFNEEEGMQFNRPTDAKGTTMETATETKLQVWVESGKSDFKGDSALDVALAGMSSAKDRVTLQRKAREGGYKVPAGRPDTRKAPTPEERQADAEALTEALRKANA